MGLAEFEGAGVKCPTPLKVQVGDFSGGLVAKTLSSNAGGTDLIPGQGTISHMPQLRPSADK